MYKRSNFFFFFFFHQPHTCMILFLSVSIHIYSGFFFIILDLFTYNKKTKQQCLKMTIINTILLHFFFFFNDLCKKNENIEIQTKLFFIYNLLHKNIHIQIQNLICLAMFNGMRFLFLCVTNRAVAKLGLEVPSLLKLHHRW